MSHHQRALMNLEFAGKLAHCILQFRKPSRTRQEMAGSTDINGIVEKYLRTGALPPVNQAPQFGDATKYQGDLTERLAQANALQAQAQADVDAYNANQKTKKQNAQQSQQQPPQNTQNQQSQQGNAPPPETQKT